MHLQFLLDLHVNSIFSISIIASSMHIEMVYSQDFGTFEAGITSLVVDFRCFCIWPNNKFSRRLVKSKLDCRLKDIPLPFIHDFTHSKCGLTAFFLYGVKTIPKEKWSYHQKHSQMHIWTVK